MNYYFLYNIASCMKGNYCYCGIPMEQILVGYILNYLVGFGLVETRSDLVEPTNNKRFPIV